MKDCEPVGAADIAKRLGIDPNTVHAWIKREQLPKPEWTVSGRPCWNWSTVRAWAEATGRL